MFKKSLLFFAFVFAFCSATVFAAAAQEDTRPVLSVNGTGEGTATPDMATITIGVTTSSSDAAEAQRENAVKSAKVHEAIRALGIDDKDIQTQNYSFQPDYRNDGSRQNVITGYTVDNSIVVVVRDIKQVGNIIDTSLANGANEVNSLDFSTKNTEDVRKAALLNAVRDAHDKAEIIAKALGKRIVDIKSVSESTGTIATRQWNAPMLMMAKDAATSIEPGSLSLSASVHIDYILSE